MAALYTRLKISREGQEVCEVLPGGRPVRLGSMVSNDVVLKGADINHALIGWDEDSELPYLEPQGMSSVMLGDQQVEGRCALPDRSLIRIASHDLLCELEIPAELDGRQYNLEDSSGEFFLDLSGPPLRGTLSNTSDTHTLLRKLELEERSGTIHVDYGGEETATILIADGKVMDATFGRYTGLEAIERIVAIARGTYDLNPMLKPSERFLDLSLTEFLERGF